MHNEWLYIGLFVVVGALVPTAAIVLSWIISPKKPNPIKQSTYECGMETVGDNWVQFKAQYYVYALMFAIFDIETIFLLPWAVAYKEFATIFPLIEMIVFILILVGGLAYAWRKGALEWL